jgi:hypothetical protein
MNGYVITYRGRPYSVCAESRKSAPAYQRAEWESASQADFEFGPEGQVLFLGREVTATVHTCRVQRWAAGGRREER